MRVGSWTTLILGLLLFVVGIIGLVLFEKTAGLIPLVLGGSLVYLGWRESRTALLVFGHTSLVIGFAMITRGIYLLPYSEPKLLHIVARPFSGDLSRCLAGYVLSITVSAGAYVPRGKIN